MLYSEAKLKSEEELVEWSKFLTEILLVDDCAHKAKLTGRKNDNECLRKIKTCVPKRD